jgi:hypothetical protein
MTSHEYKSLQVRITKLQAKRNDCFHDLKGHQEALNKMDKDLTRLRNRLEGFSSNPIMTEHSMLRYFERVLGYNLKELEESIIDENTKKTIRTIGNGKIEKNGFVLIIKNYSVLTVIKKEKEEKK